MSSLPPMPHRKRYGILCPTCDAPSKVIHTKRSDVCIERVRICRKGRGHLFETEEKLYQSEAREDWTAVSRVLNSRNLIAQIRRQRVVPGETPFRTMERIKHPT